MGWLPYGVVVGEQDAGGIELLESVDPGGYGRQGLGVLVAVCLPGQGVTDVRGGCIVALPGNDDGAVRPADDQGLMAGGVSRRWHDSYLGKDLGLAVELFVT